MTAPIAVPEWLSLPVDSTRSGSAESAADDPARARASTAGTAHDDALRGLQRLSEENGGGVMGLIKGVLPIYERLGLITSLDARRLLSGFETLQTAQASTAGRVALAERLQSLLGVASDDATSKPATLAVLAILASDAATLEANDASAARLAHVTATMAADGVGAILGIPGGPIGAYLASVETSTVVEHTHAELQWH